ncbi:MAG: hypothetical protein V4576_02570 [Patescibacteria group bacterium]
MKSITSIILIAAGVLLFIFFTRPKLAELKNTQLEVEKLNVARENAKNLEAKIKQLLATKNSITPQDLEKIDKMLPNNVENVKLIIDFEKILQALVEERGTVNLYKTTELTNTGSKKISLENPRISPGGLVDANFDSTRLGVVTFSFSVTLTYSDFLEFLRRLEHSTRVLDVESIVFTSPATLDSSTTAEPIYTFNVSLRTYWLKYISENAAPAVAI